MNPVHEPLSHVAKVCLSLFLALGSDLHAFIIAVPSACEALGTYVASCIQILAPEAQLQ